MRDSIHSSVPEIVYIGSIGPQHFPLAKLSLLAKKHVLCEKSLCMNANQTKELVAIAREQNLFLMEVLILNIRNESCSHFLYCMSLLHFI